jgi:hypothetical protein
VSNNKYGPLEFLIGNWSSGTDWTGENRAPDPKRAVENSKFKQTMEFKRLGDVNNHEQTLYGLEYKTIAWEEGDDEPFHQEIGYWLWDEENKQVLKSFVIPRGVSINAGGTVDINSEVIKVTAVVGSETYGICSNIFLDKEFKTVSYDLEITKIDNNSFSYFEDIQLKIKDQESNFSHTEKNVMKRV